MLHLCAEHLQENADHQMVAVLGIALITLGEEVGSEMALRTFDHLLHYGELPIRRAVPLAFALLNVSNPDYGIIDQLSRLTHDADPQVIKAWSSIKKRSREGVDHMGAYAMLVAS